MQRDAEFRDEFQRIRNQLHEAPPSTLVPRAATYPKLKEANRRRRKKQQQAFLRAYATVGRIDVAAKKAGFHPSTHSVWLKKYPDYRGDFQRIHNETKANPPKTLVRRKYSRRARQRPMGTGAVRRIPGGYEISWRRSEGDRRVNASERLYNVTEDQARRAVLEKLKIDRPRTGPLRYGHESAAALGLLQTQQQQETKHGARRKRNTGQIVKLAVGYGITWRDLAGKKKYENVGNVSHAEAAAILRQRIEPVLQKRGQILELAKRTIANETDPMARPAKPFEFRHSEDFRSVSLNGETFTLTSKEAQVIEILTTAHLNGTPDISTEAILDRIGSGKRVRDVFPKARRAIFHKLVRTEKRGTYRLNI